MPGYVVLLRGVNVGGANRVPMSELRALLEALGGTRVRTLLNSGNAVLAHPARAAAPLAGRVHAAIAARLQLDVPVVVVGQRELAAIVAGLPFPDVVTNPSRLLVAFAQSPDALPALEKVRALVRPPERFAIGRHAAYLWVPDGISTTAAGSALVGRAARGVTTRNWATVGKLVALLEGATGT